MKNLKKITGLVLTLALVFVLTACSKEITKTFEGTNNGLTVRNAYTATGDKITHQKTTQTMNFKDLNITTEDMKKEVISKMNEAIEKNNKLKGVKDGIEIKDDVIIETYEIDYTKADMKELVENNMIQISGIKDGNYPKFLSLSETEKNMIEAGLKEVK